MADSRQTGTFRSPFDKLRADLHKMNRCPQKGNPMAEKLQQGDRFPSLTLKLVSGETIKLPDDMPSRYVALLFYRGHW